MFQNYVSWIEIVAVDQLLGFLLGVFPALPQSRTVLLLIFPGLSVIAKSSPEWIGGTLMRAGFIDRTTVRLEEDAIVIVPFLERHHIIGSVIDLPAVDRDELFLGYPKILGCPFYVVLGKEHIAWFPTTAMQAPLTFKVQFWPFSIVLLHVLGTSLAWSK